MILSKQKAPKAEPLESLVGVTLPLVGCVCPEKCLNFSVPLFPHLENGQDHGPHFWALEMARGKGLVPICMNALFTPHILFTDRPRGNLKSSRWLTV